MSLIIHGPLDYANQAALSAAGLRRIGANARCLLHSQAFGYTGADAILPRQNITRLAYLVPQLLRCDVLHLYSGQSMFLGRMAKADARFLRWRGRRVVMEFSGTDARLPSVASAASPFYVPPDTYDEDRTNRALADWAEISSGHVVVADHNLDVELQRHFGTVHVIGLRVDTRSFIPVPPSAEASRPVLVHAPSNPRIKGTVYVREAVERLRTAGLDLEYVEVTGMSHAEAKAQYRRADLVVDQLCIGAHGVLTLEAMSLAKPVVCYVRPNLVEKYPQDLPVINASPETLLSVLGDWLQRPADRRERGIASRLYAEREHDVSVVAGRLLDVYDQLPRGS
jgi:hypothetical protein